MSFSIGVPVSESTDELNFLILRAICSDWRIVRQRTKRWGFGGR